MMDHAISFHALKRTLRVPKTTNKHYKSEETTCCEEHSIPNKLPSRRGKWECNGMQCGSCVSLTASCAFFVLLLKTTFIFGRVNKNKSNSTWHLMCLFTELYPLVSKFPHLLKELGCFTFLDFNFHCLDKQSD